MDRIDWAKGMPVPADVMSECSLTELDDAVADWLVGQLRQFAGVVTADAENPVALVVARSRNNEYRVYFGVYGRHSHPSGRASPIQCALAGSDPEGFHDVLVAAKYLPGVDVEECYFNGVELETLAEHFPRANGGDGDDKFHPDMALIKVNDSEHVVVRHRELFKEPVGGLNRPLIDTIPFDAVQRVPEELQDEIPRIVGKLRSLRQGFWGWVWFFLRLMLPAWLVALLRQWFGSPRVSLDLISHLKTELKLAIRNCTADGKTRPGRKRHAAALVSGDGWVFFSVNQRSDCDGADRCSEWRTVQRTRVGGKHLDIVLVVLFSPDYPKEGAICICGRCRDALGDCLHDGHGNMAIVYIDDDRPPVRQVLLSDPPISYHAAEGHQPMV